MTSLGHDALVAGLATRYAPPHWLLLPKVADASGFGEDRTPGFCAAHGIEPPEPVDNAPIRWGTAFEESVIMLAELAGGQAIQAREALAELAGDVPVTCHLDGLYEDGTIHEGKTTSLFSWNENWGEPGSDRIPRQYAVQVQHQMLCSGAARAIVSVLVFPARPDAWEAAGIRVEFAARHHVLTRPRAEGETPLVFASCDDWARALSQMGFFHQYPVEADPAVHAAMMESYRDFWARYVLTATPPTSETWDDVLRLMPEPRGTIVATDEQERIATEYAQIGAEMATAKKNQEKLKVALMSAIDRGAEHPIDNDSVEALILRDRSGRKIASFTKERTGRRVFRCNG